MKREAARDPRSPGLRPATERPAIPGDAPQSIASLLDRTLALDPDLPALVGRSGRLSYGELDAEVERAASAFDSLELVPGDRLAACLPNDVDIIVAFLATQRRGLVWVGVNRPLAAPEKAYILADSGASLYLTDEAGVDELGGSREELPELRYAFSVDAGGSDRDWRALVARQPVRASGRASTIDVDPFAPSAIAYTSGTTGLPKGAVHSQHNLLLPGAVARATGNRPRPPRHGVVLPLTILNLMVLGPICILQDGRCCVAMDRVDSQGVADWVRDESIGSFDGVPTIIHDLLTDPDVRPEDLASLSEPTMGGGDTPPDVCRLFRERFGGEVIVGYGMTEAPTAVTWTDGSAPPGPGLCGRPVPQVEIEIVGEAGELLPADTVGEITVRPSRSGDYAGVYTPMLGYWGKPEATDAVLRDGRYHTGDLGLIDADGNLHIRGRRSELILRGGANVYPAEVERVLQAHDGVAAAAVFGIEDERLGERVVAAIELGAGIDESEVAPLIESLRAHARANLARYKVPDAIRTVDAMPRNAMNKIVKPRLRALFAPPLRTGMMCPRNSC